jgi:KipI family sensor histidine kinase inhibitor
VNGTGTPEVILAGDSAAVVRFADRLDPAINARVLQLAAAVHAWNMTGVRDVVPAFHTVTVHFDPMRTSIQDLVDRLIAECRTPVHDGIQPARPVEIPVCYGGDLGPDLAAVAAWASLDEAAVIATHWRATYRVYMLGFLPGFAYLGAVDEQIAIPRLSRPRLHVPAGSVGIAGRQTGVYPFESPGGWHLIGRTPLVMFEAGRPHPSLLTPGDQVIFHPIGRMEYDRAVSRAEPPA